MLKERINPYKRNNVWWARIPQVDAHAIPHSLDVRDEQTAKLICAFLVWARGRNASPCHRRGYAGVAAMTLAGSIGVKMVCGRPVTVYRLQTDTEWRVSPTPPNNPNLRGRGEAATPTESGPEGSGSVRVKATQGENGG